MIAVNLELIFCFSKTLEQESYELKRLIESMRNEYEAKIYELNEDLHLLNRKLMRQEQAKTNSQQQNEQFEIIQDLNEKNQKLTDDFKSVNLLLTICYIILIFLKMIQINLNVFDSFYQ